jgi:hypothetical protein
LAAALLAIAFALAVHLSTLGAEVATPLSADGATASAVPTSNSTVSIGGGADLTSSLNCDSSTDRLLYVTALDECFPAEW